MTESNKEMTLVQRDQEVYRLRKQGMTCVKVAKKLGLSVPNVSRVYNIMKTRSETKRL